MNILLCCAAGMSTSLLVTKMEEAAREQGLEGKIWAVAANSVNQHIDDADVLLLGPQVRYLLAKINPIHYGTCNGEEVLKAAIDLVKNKE